MPSSSRGEQSTAPFLLRLFSSSLPVSPRSEALGPPSQRAVQLTTGSAKARERHVLSVISAAPAESSATRHASPAVALALASARRRIERPQPTGQCSTSSSAIGKSRGLPVARRAPTPSAAAAIRQSAWLSVVPCAQTRAPASCALALRSLRAAHRSAPSSRPRPRLVWPWPRHTSSTLIAHTYGGGPSPRSRAAARRPRDRAARRSAPSCRAAAPPPRCRVACQRRRGSPALTQASDRGPSRAAVLDGPAQLDFLPARSS